MTDFASFTLEQLAGAAHCPGSVVIAALQELDSVGLDQIDTAMFLGDAPGPDIGAEVFQGLGLADAVEGVAQNGLNQIQQSLCGTAVRLDPVL